jgi:hypothetical protein
VAERAMDFHRSYSPLAWVSAGDANAKATR